MSAQAQKAHDTAAIVGAAILTAYVITRYPRQAESVLKALAAPRSETTKKSHQADDDLFSSSALVIADGCIRKARYTRNDDHQRDVGGDSTVSVSTLCSLRLVRLSVTPRMHQWRQLLNDWRQCGDDFFMVSGDGFRFVVENTRIGRLVGLVLVHWRSLKTSQSKGVQA